MTKEIKKLIKKINDELWNIALNYNDTYYDKINNLQSLSDKLVELTSDKKEV